MGFRVTPEQLDDLGNSYSQQASAIQAAHDTLVQRSNAIEAEWSGSAAQEHQTLMQQYNAELAKMEETLNQIAANLHTAANNYREAEASAKSGFTSH